MKLLRSFIQSRYPWAILAGLLLAASFPKPGVAGFAWIAPGLILLSSIGKPRGEGFRLGYVAGLAHYLASLYWLLLIPVPWLWIWAKVLGWFALGAFIALYPALWTWLSWKLLPVQFAAAGSGSNLVLWSQQFLSIPWLRRATWALASAALWVALEMTVARFLGGFPWNLLGDSQFRILPLIQVAAWTGVYGVSFLLVWTSLSLLGAGLAILGKPAMRSVWVGEIILPALAVVVLFGAGYRTLMQPKPRRPELTVVMVQPSIPQNLIWDATENTNRFNQLLRLSERALTNHPDLLIWPEAAVPKMLRYDQETYEAITGLARSHKAWMIIGSDDAERRPNARNPDDADFYNSAFLVSPEGSVTTRYQKRNLVIFGEYVPLIRWLPFLKYLTPIEGGFTAGERVVPFEMPDLKVNVSVLICFEDIFPHLAREYVSDDSDFLVNLTNNGWFGEGAAQWQHGAAAIFRAVENGLPLVRCANNGLTCWVDAHGRLRQILETPARGIYGPGFLTARIPVLAPGETRAATFYRRHGDVFGWGCVGFALLQLTRVWVARRKSAPPLS